MNPIWVLVALAAPPILAVLSATILRSQKPGPHLVIGLNAISSGSGLAAAGRPTLEVVLGVLFAQICILIVGKAGELWMYVPCMMTSGVWALLHTPLNPITRAAAADRERLESRAQNTHEQKRTLPPPVTNPTRAGKDNEAEADVDVGFSVEVRCTECGADIDVPVLHHMAKCSFCGSKHLVVGHDDTLQVVLPEKIQDRATLRETLLEHYRYQHYLKLYKRAVAPIALGATDASTSGGMIDRPEMSALAGAAEAAVSIKADAYRRNLEKSIIVGQTIHFLAPYRHGVGTLYQASFGRSPDDQEKQLCFAVGTVEASALANETVKLPKMGKLSYLKALRPAADCDSSVLTLPLGAEEKNLIRAFGNLDRRRLVRDLQIIRLGSRFIREVSAVVWRSWWIFEVRCTGINETVLIDGGAASVVGPAPDLDPESLIKLPASAREPGSGLQFVPMECPTCGDEFDFDPNAVLHFCHNCHRVCGVDGNRKREVEYAHIPLPADDDWDLVPFWQFPLRLRTKDGELITDLLQLKDGIDGTLDQIGDDAAIRQHAFFVPAIRCINARLMADAFNRIFHFTVRQRPPKTSARFPLETQPRPWSVSLAEPEARQLAPLYLSNAFSRRDITKVNVHQVSSWLFESQLEVPGRLAFMPVPKPVTEPFRRYLGRSVIQAVQKASGRG